MDVMQSSVPQMRRMLAVLRDVRGEMSSVMTDLMRSPEDKYTAHRHRATLVQLDEAIRLVETRLPGATLDDLQRESRRAATTGLRRMRDMVEAGQSRVDGAISNLRLPTARILADGQQTMMSRHEAASYRYAGAVGRRIRHDLAIGVVRGESVSEMAERLLRGDYKRGSRRAVGEAIAERQFFRNKSDAERLVRTELVNAYSSTQIDALKELDEDDPGYLKMWDAHADMRVCKECYALHGQIAPLNRPFKGGVWHPPLHPRDRCAVVPWHRDWGRPPKI